MLTVERGPVATRKPLRTYSPSTAPIRSRRSSSRCAAGKPSLEYWTNVADTEQNIQFGYEILSVIPEQGIARWWASFVIVPPGLETKLDGIFLISLDENGRCYSLREWWHKQQD